MFFWGVCTVCEGLVKNFASLVALRFLLGVFEAGLVPGAVYLISMYYKRYELQWRLSVFFCASILAGAFGGLLAYALAHMDGVGGYSGQYFQVVDVKSEPFTKSQFQVGDGFLLLRDF
jgi:MFS family permease